MRRTRSKQFPIDSRSLLVALVPQDTIRRFDHITIPICGRSPAYRSGHQRFRRIDVGVDDAQVRKPCWTLWFAKERCRCEAVGTRIHPRELHAAVFSFSGEPLRSQPLQIVFLVVTLVLIECENCSCRALRTKSQCMCIRPSTVNCQGFRASF